MRNLQCLLAIVLLGAPALAAAQSDEGATAATVGRIERIYVRRAEGVYVESGLAARGARGERWVEVRMGRRRPGVPATAFVRVPAALDAEPGDIVEVRFAGREEFQVGPLPETDRVVKHVAPADSVYARTFGFDPPAAAATPRWLQISSLDAR